MLDGDFERAWRISDWVLRQRFGQQCTHLPRHLQWVWDGSPIDHRDVLARCYHGLGDTIQFVRFIPALSRRARSVSVEAQPELLSLLRSIPEIDALYPLGGNSLDAADVDIESMELAHVLRITLDTLPARVPYLRPPDTFNNAARHLIGEDGGALRVGLVWTAGNWRRERSIPARMLARLADVPVAFFNLQPGGGCVDAPLSFAGTLPEVTPLEVTAALMFQLDVVVTVDTMIAHLAGALGRPVWVLLDAEADWRWMRGRADSPWYPTMRLFRQTCPGDWQPVIDAIADRLLLLAKSQRERRAPSSRSEKISQIAES